MTYEMNAEKFCQLTGWSFDEEVQKFSNDIGEKIPLSDFEARVFIDEENDERPSLSLHYFAGANTMPNGYDTKPDGYCEINSCVGYDEEISNWIKSFAVIIRAVKDEEVKPFFPVVNGICVPMMYTPPDDEKDGFWDIAKTDCTYSDWKSAADDYLVKSECF